MRADLLILLGTATSSSPGITSYLLLLACCLTTLATRLLTLGLAILFRYEVVVALLDITSSPSSSPSSSGLNCSQIGVVNATHGGVEVYKFDGTFYNSQSGSKKLFEYRGILSWVDDGGDYLSLDQIQDKIPRYFCMDNIIRYNIIPYYLVTVTAASLLPSLLLSSLVMLVVFKARVCLVVSDHPLLLLSPLLSHLTISRSGPSHLSLSVKMSSLNLLLTSIISLTVLGLIISASPHNLQTSSIILGSAFLLLCLSLLASLCRFTRYNQNVKIVFKTGDLKQSEAKLSLLL